MHTRSQSRAAREEALSELNGLPVELLQKVIAEHLPSRKDVKALSRTCRALHALISTPAVVAAWLWNVHGASAPFMAMTRRDMPVFRQLIEVQRADVNGRLPDDGMPLLHMACRRRGRSAFIAYLLAAPGMDVNAGCRTEGGTALHYAALGDNGEAVRQLLAVPEVDVNAAANDGKTALHLAAQGGHLDALSGLLASPPRADVNITTASGASALLLAAYGGHSAAVAMLLAHPGTRVNASEGSRITSLHCACYQGHTDVVRELLKRPDIELQLTTLNGLTARDLAERRGHQAIVQALDAHVA